MRCLFIDSRDRSEGTTTSFQIQLGETLSIDRGATRMRIDNLRIPLVTPLVQQGVNDTIAVASNGYNYVATIAPGGYDGVVLASVIQAGLQAAANAAGQGGTWVVTYLSQLAGMSFTYGAAFTFGQTGGFLAPYFLHPYAYSNGGKTLTLSYVNVQPIDVFYLCSQRFANADTFGPQGDHSMLMSAVVDEPFASILNASMPVGVWLNVPAITTQQLDFQIRDRYYNLVPNLPNISFVLTLDSFFSSA